MSYLEIELTAVDWRNEQTQGTDHVATLRVVENDLEQEVMQEVVPAAEPAPDFTYPITVNLDDVREYYPRRPGRNGLPRTGTRLVFKNGAGRPVQESYADVRTKIATAVAAMNGGRRAR